MLSWMKPILYNYPFVKKTSIKMKIKRCLLSQKVEGSGPRDNIRGIVESCPAMIYTALKATRVIFISALVLKIVSGLIEQVK